MAVIFMVYGHFGPKTPVVDVPQSLKFGQFNARPTVTSMTAEHSHYLAGSMLDCLVFFSGLPGQYSIVKWVRLELATS